MGGGGAPNLSNMSEMMNNPSMQNIIKNPDFLKSTLSMLKDPNNKGMLDMMT